MAAVVSLTEHNGDSRKTNGVGKMATDNGHMALNPIKPAPDQVLVDEKSPPIVYERDNAVGPGLLREDLYESQMGPLRAGIRRMLIRNLVTESNWLAKMQDVIRRPILDTYFVYTSSLGTHTFFMTMLPAFFFFGHEGAGRGLVQVIGMGVYISSLVKDSICAPRPLAPPVTRLTVGSHHLEYGFPSTHSTNSVSIALFFWSIIRSAHIDSVIPQWTYVTSCVLLSWYAFSIVFGRLYCAMHSLTDCVAGICIGTTIWATQWTWGHLLEDWIHTSGWEVPLVIVTLGLVLVHVHPDPVDDCPCFEDSIAFLAVIVGCIVSAWFRANWGYTLEDGFFRAVMPSDWIGWTAVASGKMFLGILIVFVWRLAAKAILHAILPPLFRFLSLCFTLPNRRFYTPATDYKNFPESKGLLHDPIPSVIDLPAMNHHKEGAVLLPVSRGMGSVYGDNAKLRSKSNGKAAFALNGNRAPEKKADPVTDNDVKHYDADVLTKVIVYAGIAFLATSVIPILFEAIGWGVYSRISGL